MLGRMGGMKGVGGWMGVKDKFMKEIKDNWRQKRDLFGEDGEGDVHNSICVLGSIGNQ